MWLFCLSFSLRTFNVTIFRNLLKRAGGANPKFHFYPEYEYLSDSELGRSSESVPRTPP
jgi:hypothetical protein